MLHFLAETGFIIGQIIGFSVLCILPVVLALSTVIALTNQNEAAKGRKLLDKPKNKPEPFGDN